MDEQRRTLPKFGFGIKVKTSSYKKLFQLLPWWKRKNTSFRSLPCKIVRTLGSDDGTADTDLLTSTGASSSYSTTLPRGGSPSSSTTPTRAKEASKRKLQKSNDLTKTAVASFYMSCKINDYLDEIQLWDNYSEENWFHHYNSIVSKAFEFESNIGTQTAVSWALSCLKTMTIRIADSEKRFILLLKLAFVWYNFTLDLKYRYAADVKVVINTFKACKESFFELIDCLEEKDKVLLNDVFNLVQASFYNKISNDENTEADKSRATIKQFVENFESGNNLHIPHILIGLYYHELALMAHVKGELEAISYLRDALEHLDLMQLEEDLTYRYFLDVVFDLTRFYDQGNLATKTSSKDLLSKVYSTIKENECKYEKSPAAIIFYFALCSLSVHHVGEGDVLERHCNDLNRKATTAITLEVAGDLEEYKSFDNTAGGHLSTTFFSYATQLFPHFLKCKEFGRSYYVGFLRIYPVTILYGYKGIAIAVHLLISMLYHDHEGLDKTILFADNILRKIDLQLTAQSEILTYLKFVKIFKAICNYRANKPKAGQEILNKTMEISLENNFKTFVKLLLENLKSPNTCVALSSTFVRDTNQRIVEKVLIAMAANQFRKNFPSQEENIETLVKAFEKCAIASANVASTT